MSGRIAELQVVLEGVPLPAAKRELVAHARGEDAPRAIVALLEALPERKYASIDEVAETIQPVQPAAPRSQPHEPKVESGALPGGEAYTTPPERAR
jgi:hypothetical protein